MEKTSFTTILAGVNLDSDVFFRPLGQRVDGVDLELHSADLGGYRNPTKEEEVHETDIAMARHARRIS